MRLRQVFNELVMARNIFRDKPFQVLVQVSNRCNLRCGFCEFWTNPAASSEELSLDELRGFSNELAKIGSFLVSIEGGEPLVRPDIVEIVRSFSKQHTTVLFTNGWYVDATLAHRLFAAGLSQAGISIDFSAAPRHDACRGVPGSYDKAVAALRIMKAAAPKGGKQLHIMSVLMRENQHDLEALLQLSAKEQVGHYITLLSRSGIRRGKEHAMPDDLRVCDLLALRRKYPHFRNQGAYLETIGEFLQGNQLPVCNAGIRSFNLDHLGNVAACIEKIGRTYGNIRQQPLADILLAMAEGARHQDCQDCWTLCRGNAQLMADKHNLRAWRDLMRRRYAV